MQEAETCREFYQQIFLKHCVILRTWGPSLRSSNTNKVAMTLCFKHLVHTASTWSILHGPYSYCSAAQCSSCQTHLTWPGFRRQRPHPACPDSFSVSSNLTYLGTGTFYGSHRSDILSMRVFPNLHKLRLYGSMRPDTYVPDVYEPDKYEDSLRVWDALTSLKCVKKLRLVHPDYDDYDDNEKHTYDILQRVGTLTHFTHLGFSSHNPELRYQHLDESLLHLSALTNLQVLRCHFPKPDLEQPGDCGHALASVLAQGSICRIDIDLHCDCCNPEECV